MAKEIRFAVGRSEDLRSSVWRLWPNKNELYLAARSIAGLSKISFHSSGICRYAVVSKEPRPPLDSWRRPGPSEPGVTPLFDLVFPPSPVANAFQDTLPEGNKPTLLLVPPPDDAKLIVRILLTDPSFTKERIQALARGKPVAIHGSVQMLSETAWLVSYLDALAPSEREFVSNLIKTTKIHMSPGSSADEFGFAGMHSIEKTNPRTLVDLQLGPDNLDIPQASPDASAD